MKVGTSLLEELIGMLEASRRDVDDAIASLSDANISRKPQSGGWSALDCLEHIVFVEGVYLSWLENALVLEEPRRDPEREAWITARVGDRSWDWQAPAVATPKGRFRSMPEALAEFHAVRARTVAAVKARESSLLRLQASHSLLGIMNGVELVRLAAGHASRHAVQIRKTGGGLG